MSRYLRINIVIELGFEPKTHSLEGCCSIQLSYSTILFRGAKVGVYFEYTKLFPTFFFPSIQCIWLKYHLYRRFTPSSISMR